MPEAEPPSECAQCGASIPRRARACPACGADERTGWRETSLYDGLDLPDAAWQDEDEDGKPQRPRRRVNGLAWYWWLAALALMVLFLFVSFGGR